MTQRPLPFNIQQRNIQRYIVLLIQALLIIACEIVNGLAFQSLIVPAKLLSGGIVGSALLLHQLFNLPIGIQTTLYNVPIFILGWRYLGRRFTVLSIIGVLSFSFFVDALHPPVLTQDLLLLAVFGGVITGIADGIIMRTGGSTGGFDILGLIVSRRFNFSAGQVFLIFNGVIIGLGALFNTPELAMYTLIMLFVSTRTIDVFLTRSPRPVALIISMKDKEIVERLLHDLGRGVTYLEGGGAYTSTQMRVLMCVISRYELHDLRQIVREVDANAFTIILNASDVIGKFDRGSPLQSIFG